MTSRSLWNYYRGEVNDDENETGNANNKINNDKIITSKSFEYKTKTIGKTPDDNNTLDTEVVNPLKFALSNSWRFLNLPLINCEIEFDLSWSKECIISEKLITPIVTGNPTANPSVSTKEAVQTASVTFQINNGKLYVPVVTLSINDNIKF